MKETIQSSETPITYPPLGQVEVPTSVDWVYIMRKDSAFTMEPIAKKLAHDGENSEAIQIALEEEYDIFFSQLADTLTAAFSEKGRVELHLFDPQTLANASLQKAEDVDGVSLDPLLSTGVHELKVSRAYYSSGTQDITQVNRPGSEPLTEQVDSIKKNVQGNSVNLFEDDLFSGGSLGKALDLLITSGFDIHKIIPGIQVGNPEKITAMGIDVDPVVQYKTSDGTDIFDKVDLGDPRDYLVGASGLVIKFPNGDFGRAPYIPPFVSSTARAGIPKELEKEFSQKVLMMNYAFFERSEEKIGQEIKLKHMDSHFGNYLHEVFGIEKDTPMKTVITWLLDNQQTLWERSIALGELQKKVDDLQLPTNLVFLDVNGTILPSDYKGGEIDTDSLQKFQDQVLRLQQSGVGVGLCSDSPLPQLEEFAKKLGIVDAPIIFENGNGITNKGNTLVIQSVPNLDGVKQKIINSAEETDYKQVDDSVAIEFGGNPPNSKKNEWSFGANRQTSISIFGPSNFIISLGKLFENSQGVSIDCSPEYNYFAVHPGSYKMNKGIALKILAAFGHNTVMVGDSMSDYVEKQSGVMSTFVGNGRVTEAAQQDATYISEKNIIEGVIDILNQLQIKSK